MITGTRLQIVRIRKVQPNIKSIESGPLHLIHGVTLHQYLLHIRCAVPLQHLSKRPHFSHFLRIDQATTLQDPRNIFLEHGTTPVARHSRDQEQQPEHFLKVLTATSTVTEHTIVKRLWTLRAQTDLHALRWHSVTIVRISVIWYHVSFHERLDILVFGAFVPIASIQYQESLQYCLAIAQRDRGLSEQFLTIQVGTTLLFLA